MTETGQRECRVGLNREEKEVKHVTQSCCYILLCPVLRSWGISWVVLRSSTFLFCSCSPSFHFVQNKQLSFSMIIDEETFKSLEHYAIATSLILPLLYVVLLGCIFYSFHPKGHSAKSNSKEKEKLVNSFSDFSNYFISFILPFFPPTIRLNGTHWLNLPPRQENRSCHTVSFWVTRASSQNTESDIALLTTKTMWFGGTLFPLSGFPFCPLKNKNP